MSSDIKRVFDAIAKKIESLSRRTTKSDMREIGEFVAEMIRRRTRLGYGLSRSRNKERLASLEPETIAQRKKARLSQSTSPARSNLTRTGQLLDALRCVDASESSSTVGFAPESRSDSRVSNSRLARIHEFEAKKRRAFFGLTPQEQKQLVNFVRKILSRKK